MNTSNLKSDVLVVGGGLAGIVTALETLRAGKTVVLIDRDTPERLGGLALWAFGGMALVGTKHQARQKIPDTPERALADWLRFGEVPEGDVLARQWARYYVENSHKEVYDWLLGEGVKFMPAVGWAERGRFGDGNSLPRYHFVWGTSRELVRCMITAMNKAGSGDRLRVLHQYRVTALEHQGGQVSGAVAHCEQTGQEVRVQATHVVLAMGGINGSHEQVGRHWPPGRPKPVSMLNGAHPFADGKLHELVAREMGGQISNAGEMWNYAAGFPHPQPHFDGHGLSIIPCKSALWLDHSGRRIGPEPLVTGFDTHWLCQRVAEQEQPWTWHLLNWRIAIKEFAISGAEHNTRIRDKQFLAFLKETLLGNHRLVRQIQQESPYFLVDESLVGLAAKMNALTGSEHVDPLVLQATANAYDANFSGGKRVHNDDQIRRIWHTRQWGADRLRTCKPVPLQKPGCGPFIAIHTQLITRKSLGGLRTDLNSRVLDAAGNPIPGLYCVGEAAGFGGGSSNGKRSLEGTFLPGCILTARAAARSINELINKETRHG